MIFSPFMIVACVGSEIVRGDPTCYEEPWTDCSSECSQNRMVPSSADEDKSSE